MSLYSLRAVTLALVLVTLPLAEQQPTWWMPLLALLALLRAAQGQQVARSWAWLALPVAVAAGVGIVQQDHTLLGPEAGVAILAVLAALKLMEARSARDIQVMVVVSVFLLGCQFLFFQDLGHVLYALPVLWLLLVVLIKQEEVDREARAAWGLSLRLLLQAVPVMLLFFILFPRIPPLWVMPAQSSEATTGLSDDMSPGDISHLGSSLTEVFRVHMEKPELPVAERYWRVNVLEAFDGRSWHHRDAEYAGWLPKPETSQVLGPVFTYDIDLLLPYDQWLPAAAWAQPLSPRIDVTSAGLLRYRGVMPAKLIYRVATEPERPLGIEAFAAELRQDRLLPRGGAPQAYALAQRWRQESATDQIYIDRVLAYFHQGFFYTLDPPPLGADAVDAFLFQTRRGFCEHFASAFTVLMRAADLPARVVIGYQGGTWLPYSGDYSVRQMDAHAWSEVWLQGRGWVRVDPTAAVAPDRILKGAEGLAQQPAYWGGGTGQWLAYGRYRGWAHLQLVLDDLNAAWSRQVVHYDSRRLDGWMPQFTGWTPLMVRNAMLALGFMLLLVVLAGWNLRPKRLQRDPVDRIYLVFIQYIQRHGVKVSPGETAEQLADRLAQMRPDAAELLRRHAKIYNELRYADLQEQPRYYALLRRYREVQRSLLRQLRSMPWDSGQ